MLSETIACPENTTASESDFCLASIKWDSGDTIIQQICFAAKCIGTRFVSGKPQVIVDNSIVRIYTKAEKPTERRDIRIYLCGILDAYEIKNEYVEYY